MHIWEYQEILYQDYLYPATHYYKKQYIRYFFKNMYLQQNSEASFSIIMQPINIYVNT